MILFVSRRNPLHALFSKPNSLKRDIAEIESRQLAPSVGTQRVGSAISAASSTSKFRYAAMPFGLTNASSARSTPSAIYDAIYLDSEAAARSITFGSFDFTPYSSMSKLVFKSLDTGIIKTSHPNRCEHDLSGTTLWYPRYSPIRGYRRIHNEARRPIIHGGVEDLALAV